jgi:cytochrome P450
VSSLPPSIPRAPEPERFRADPLGFLTRAREELGDIVVLRERGAIFSRTPDCSGVVAVFGSQRQRAVLGDIDAFGMPPSAAKHLALDEALTNLNRSLHSMRGEEHAAQKRTLTSVLDANVLDDALVSGALEELAARWQPGTTIALLREMRALTVQLASRVLFGAGHAGSEPLAELLDAYFHLRREAASPASVADDAVRDALVAAGEALDDALRHAVRASRRGGAASHALLGRLAAPEAGLTEDEVVGHANILFISSSEPIAVALTWTLLILSQLPALRCALRDELSAGPAAHPSHLDRVISESLRLLPPNALMARITTRPLSLCGTELPANCEVVLSPFVAHRDAERFPDPRAFRPSRWIEARPSPFDYFPFGAGGHACVGRGLALHLMKRALSFLLTRYDLVLAGDQEIDWRVHIMFMPHDDPSFLVAGPHSRGGKLRGAVGDLLSLVETTS